MPGTKYLNDNTKTRLTKEELEIYKNLNKRDKKTILLLYGLGSEINPYEYEENLEKMLFRPDVGALNALSIDRFDWKERNVAFLEAIYVAIENDTEYLHKIAQYIVRGLQVNSAERLLYGLCGFGANELAKRARILPDDALEFFSAKETAKLFVRWTNGAETSSKCKVQSSNFKVCDFKDDVFYTFAESAQICEVCVEVAPTYTRNPARFNCISKEERQQTGDKISYWYRHPDEKPKNKRCKTIL
jgi:hypothetical protein